MSRQSRTSLRNRSGHGGLGMVMRKITSVVRRMRITASSGALWSVDTSDEEDTAENFENAGFASRPAADDNAEAIVLKVGGESGHPVIVATRNRDSFKILEAGEGIEAGETAIYTSSSMVKIRADGTIELGSIGGSRQALATKADIDALKTWAATHTHLYAPGPGSPVATATGLPVPPTAVGTTKVEAE